MSLDKKVDRMELGPHQMAWVEALESGEYKRGKLQLKNPDTGGYCCLGVACEISELGSWDTFGHYLDSKCYLPVKVLKWLGLRDECGSIYSYTPSRCNSLIEANDHKNFGFKKIAKMIRENPDNFFDKSV